MLEVRAVTVAYGGAVALHDTTLNVADGEVVAVLGPNGAGKSTLLSAITGIKSIAAGDIRIAGTSIIHEPAEAIVRRGVALVPEGRRIFGSLKVRENLLLGATSRRDKGAVRTDLQEVYAMFPVLATYQDTSAGRLSGGEQQQLAIARALLSRPRLLLLDEPSLGLAPLMVKLVYEKLAQLHRGGITILLVEQSVELAVSLAHRVYILRRGSVAFEGAAGPGADRAGLEQAYFGYSAAESSG